MANASSEGKALLAAMREASAPADGDDACMTPADHLDHAHQHTVAAVHHVGQAAGHILAAGGISPDTGEWTDADRALPAAASPQAGYAQNRTGFAARSGAARAFRGATGRRG